MDRSSVPTYPHNTEGLKCAPFSTDVCFSTAPNFAGHTHSPQTDAVVASHGALSACPRCFPHTQPPDRHRRHLALFLGFYVCVFIWFILCPRCFTSAKSDLLAVVWRSLLQQSLLRNFPSFVPPNTANGGQCTRVPWLWRGILRREERWSRPVGRSRPTGKKKEPMAFLHHPCVPNT